MKSSETVNPLKLLGAGRVRIISNYARLFVTFSSGLMIVRLMAEINASALTVFLLMSVIIGIGQVPKAIIEESTVPLLGQSFGRLSQPDFANVRWRVQRAAFLAAFSTAFIFLVAALIAENFNTGEISTNTIFLLLFAGATKVVGSIVAAPSLGIILISGRIIHYNTAIIIERLGDLVAAAIAAFVIVGPADAALVTYFLLSAGLNVAVYLGIIMFARWVEAVEGHAEVGELLPSESASLSLGKLISWNFVLVIGFLMHVRITTLAVNITLGEAATLVLATAFVFVGYLRQVSMGLAIGLDAVASRLSGRGSSVEKSRADAKVMHRLALSSAYMQAALVGMLAATTWVIADPLLTFWLGDITSDATWDMGVAVLVLRLLLIGTFARAASEGWMKIMNGMGKIGAYAGFVFAGGVINVLCLGLFAFLLFIDDHLDTHSEVTDNALIVLAGVHAVIFVAVHLGAIPSILGRILALSRFVLLRPVAVPLATSLIVGTLGWLLPAGGIVVYAVPLLSIFGLGFIMTAPARRLGGQIDSEPQTLD